MSRSRTALIKENPCKRFLSWKTIKKVKEIDGEKIEIPSGGTFVYWDREEEKNIEIKLPLKFAIINASTISIKGYDEKRKRGVYSNEVISKEDVITLRAKDEKLLSFKLGEYKLNKDIIKSFGGRYTQSVYIAVKVKSEWELWNLQLNGAPLTGGNDLKSKDPEDKFDGWFGFLKKLGNNKHKYFIEVEGSKIKKKGSNKYTIPEFQIGELIDEEEGEIFDEMDRELNEYLDYYLSKGKEESKISESKVLTDDDEDDSYEDETPF